MADKIWLKCIYTQTGGPKPNILFLTPHAAPCKKKTSDEKQKTPKIFNCSIESLTLRKIAASQTENQAKKKSQKEKDRNKILH